MTNVSIRDVRKRFVDAAHEERAETVTTLTLEHEHVGDPTERLVVVQHSREPDHPRRTISQ